MCKIWNDPEKQKPESETRVNVLIDFEGKRQVIVAMFIPRWTVESRYFFDYEYSEPGEGEEYSEAEDKYFVSESWYERNLFDPTSWRVDGEAKILGWLPLPTGDAEKDCANSGDKR